MLAASYAIVKCNSLYSRYSNIGAPTNKTLDFSSSLDIILPKNAWANICQISTITLVSEFSILKSSRLNPKILRSTDSLSNSFLYPVPMMMVVPISIIMVQLNPKIFSSSLLESFHNRRVC